ncbi:hypothetical protein XU18_2136 [Perkinsela sp. CCAP 1560/4]|nr:hypothetical protein XU18_2136 [Perkinsela sp. CCAP 1560/4]|eukprot:KNH07160.1 hypothetical protein XU18_2136 [Perkinsela sp. CCAP 1560/4]
MSRKFTLPPNLSLTEIGNHIGGPTKNDITRRMAFAKLKDNADEKRRKIFENYDWQTRRQDVLTKKYDGDITQAIREYIQPSTSKNKVLKELPFEKKIMEEIYEEQHGMRAHRRLRSELKWEKWIARGDDNVPVSKACEKAQLAFGMGNEIVFTRAARVPEEFPTVGKESKNKHKITTKNQAFEVPLIGRTNVGKSSLINTLLNTYVADYDSSPGTTLTANFYCLGSRMTLVDTPGYSYISPMRAPGPRIAAVHELVKSYIEEVAEKRRWCPRMLVCIHAKVGVHGADRYFLDMLEERKIKFSVVMTKTDEVPVKRLIRMTAFTRNLLMNYSHCEELMLVSALQLSGVRKMQNLLSIFGPRQADPHRAIEEEIEVGRIV